MRNSGLIRKELRKKKEQRFFRYISLSVQVIKYIVLIILFIFCILPFVWMGFTALRNPEKISIEVFKLPDTLHWENFITAWTVGRFGVYIGNSFIITIPVVIGVCTICALTGYAFSKLDFVGRNLVFYLFLVGLMIPFQIIMVPLYYELRNLGILTTYWAAILPMIALGLPFGTFLMRAFFNSLPDELIDAARIDGCSSFGVFWRVMLPLAAPGLGSLAIFSFLSSWNNFLIPLIYLQKEKLRPITVGLIFFQSRYRINYVLIAAGAIIATVPIIIVYLILQRQFIKGFMAGALKG